MFQVRALFLSACIGCLLAAPKADCQTAVVLGIEGDWWDSMGHVLNFASVVNTKCVFGVKGALQIAESRNKAQTFVPEKMTRSCPCTFPTGVPKNAVCAKVDLEASQAVNEPSWWSRVVDRLVRSPQLYIVAAARGLEQEPQEAVLPLSGTEVDLASAMRALDAGAYTVSLEPVNSAAVGKLNGKLAWSPGKPARLQLPKISPGLYRIVIAVEGGESEGSEAWVLVTPAAHYDANTKDFHQAIEITESWGERVDANGKRAMLRACLQSLADRDAGK